jgi:DNA processing protein
VSGTERPMLTDRQRFFWLKLIRTPNIGPATFRDLLNRFGSAEKAVAALPGLHRSSGSKRALTLPPDGEIERELERAGRMGARFVALGDADYPANLEAMDYPPPLVAVKGDAAVFGAPAVSVVGARNASLAGIKVAKSLAAELGQAGFAVVSGLARGIDTAAHRGALETGTVGVLAGGLDRPYPPENVPLLKDIVARGGAVVSEMPFGWEPRAQDFPRRNRIIAGLSLGLVVVEAAKRSGSLISARLAGEIGRIVFAVPGSPLDPRAAGTNGLLKDGAVLVTEAADVIEAIRPITGLQPARQGALAETPDPEPIAPVGGDARAVLAQALGPTPVGFDDLVAHTGLSTGAITLVLLEFDLAGRLERHPGGAVSLLPE